MLHGGAGVWSSRPWIRKSIEAIKECTSRCWSKLLEANNALEAVVEAVRCMEDSGYLNAGYGSSPNLLGERELDAGLMTSSGLIGAVAAVKLTKNPVLLARLVAELTPHAIIAGEGADRLALMYGLPQLPPIPQHVMDMYVEALKKVLSGKPTEYSLRAIKSFLSRNEVYAKLVNALVELHGTVGAVAVDDSGLLAAATSTGGLMLKLPGRVGDTPIPGAGFYASSSIACSATGVGEFIIRSMPCLRLSLEYEVAKDAHEALRHVADYVERVAGPNTMGFIAVDKSGRLMYAYNTEAMLIGYIKGGEVVVELRPEPKVAVII